MRLLLLATLCVVLSSCELGLLPLEPPLPAAEELVFADQQAQVVLMLGEASGFPDPYGSYAIVVQSIAHGRVTVTEGTAQRTSIAHQVVAARLPSGDLGIAWHSNLCRVTGAIVECADLERESGSPSLIEALRWRAGAERMGAYSRAPAALALSDQDPAAAIAFLDELDGSIDLDPATATQVRGVLARLRHNTTEIDALASELHASRNPAVIGLARACVPELMGPIRAELAARPDSVRELVNEALSDGALGARR